MNILNKNIRLVILQRLIPHYRKGFFEKINGIFPEAKMIYGQATKTDSLKNAVDLDKNIFIKVKNLYFGNSGKIFISGMYSFLIRYKPEVIISVFNVGNLNIYILFLLKFILKYKIILWSFGYDPDRGFDPKNRLADKLRLKLSEKADAVIFYWEKGRAEISKHTKKTDHFFMAPNTIDTDKLLKIKSELDKTGVENLKKELGIKEKYHFIFISRLVKEKEADVLIKAFSQLEKKRQDCRLSIIGAGPESESLRSLSESLNVRNIYFMGEIINDEETGKWIYVSDAFVLPGRLGNSVVQAFCFGTPVISQNKEYTHCEGIGYINEGLNGFLVVDGNINEISERMEQIISDPELSEKLRINAFSTAVNDCSIEKMTEGYTEAINFVTIKKNGK